MTRRLAFALVLALIALLPFHAFAWTWFHSYFWTDSWAIVVQAWKEILVGILACIASVHFLREPRRLLAGANLLVIAALGAIAMFTLIGPGELTQKIYGARTLALPLIAFLAAQATQPSDHARSILKITLFTVSGLVAAFALAQIFILPTDFLASFGYSTVVSTWLPGGNLPMYHIVGGTDLIRAQSTFAGPNQLGAYLVLLLPLVLGTTLFAWRTTREQRVKVWVLIGLMSILTLALALTYSRAAWLAAGIEFIVLAIAYVHHHHRHYLTRRTFALVIFMNLILMSSIFVLIPTEWETTLIRTASTSGHATRTLTALHEVVAHPAGLGLGSTAGISQRFDEATHVGLTPENTYLGWLLELGWLGGALIMATFATLTYHLARRRNPLAVSLIGIGVIALVLHPLEDAPTALTLALLAGLEYDPTVE